MGTFGRPKPNELGQAVQYGGQQQQRIQGALTGSIPSRDSGFGPTQPVNVNVADIVGATAQHLAGPTPPPPLGANVPTQPMQLQPITPMAPQPSVPIAATGTTPVPGRDYGTLRARLQETATNPDIARRAMQGQYEVGTQQGIDSAMNTSGVTIQELIRRIANRPKF